MSHLNKSVKSLCFSLILTVIVGFVYAPGSALADGGTGLQIQNYQGKTITKEQVFSAIFTGVWQAGKSEVCNEISKVLSKPGDYSAYNIQCNLGDVVNVTVAQPLKDGFMLRATLNKSHITADYTQSYAGKWADPSVSISWDSLLSAKVKYTDDGTCPGVPGKLPWLRFESATFEMLSPNVDVSSTIADLVGAISGLVGGTLIGAPIPLAIAGAVGTDAIIDGVAQGQVPRGKINFASQANEKLMKTFSPCELVNKFGGLVGKFQTKSLTSNMVTLAATSRRQYANSCVSSLVKGQTDLAAVWNDGGSASIAVFPSDGTKFTGYSQWVVRDGGWGDSIKWVSGDFNGDGLTDIVAIWNNGGSNTLTVRASTGSTFTQSHWLTNAGGWLDSTAWCVGQFRYVVNPKIGSSADFVLRARHESAST